MNAGMLGEGLGRRWLGRLGRESGGGRGRSLCGFRGGGRGRERWETSSFVQVS